MSSSCKNAIYPINMTQQTSEHTKLEQWYGFYTSKPFWAVTRPDFSNNALYPSFSQTMSEIVAEYEEQYYKLRICRDGFVLFSSKLQNLDFKHILEYLNAIHIILESETQKWTFAKFSSAYEINSEDVVPITMSGSIIKGMNDSRTSSTVKYLYNSRFLPSFIPLDYQKLNWNDSFWLGLIKHTVTFDPRINQREGRVLPKPLLDQVNSVLLRVMQNYTTVSLLALMSKSLEQFEQKRFDISVIMSWFIIESYIFKLYQTRVMQGLSTDFQEITSSQALKALQQRKVLAYDFIGDIHKIRVMRNDITHNTFEAQTTAQEANLALLIIQQFIRQDVAIDIELKYL